MQEPTLKDARDRIPRQPISNARKQIRIADAYV